MEATVQYPGSHVQRSWKDGSGMLGRHLCWRYRFGSHLLIKKIEIMGLDMKTIYSTKIAKVRVLGSIRIAEDCILKLFDDILEKRGVWVVGEVRKILGLPLCPVMCGAEGYKGRVLRGKPGL